MEAVHGVRNVAKNHSLESVTGRFLSHGENVRTFIIAEYSALSCVGSFFAFLPFFRGEGINDRRRRLRRRLTFSLDLRFSALSSLKNGTFELVGVTFSSSAAIRLSLTSGTSDVRRPSDRRFPRGIIDCLSVRIFVRKNKHNPRPQNPSLDLSYKSVRVCPTRAQEV